MGAFVPEVTTMMESIDLSILHQVASRRRAARDEATIRWLLGQWASELEPSVARDHATMRILGLCVADDPTGFIVVPAPGHSRGPVSDFSPGTPQKRIVSDS